MKVLRTFLILIGLAWAGWSMTLTVAGGQESSQAASASPRTLIIALDAVPYDVVVRLTAPKLGDQALFQGFRGPVPLISTFPSTTSLAFGGILEPFGLERSPGYEARFFDRQANRVRSGGLISYHKIKFPWRSFWNWKTRNLSAKLTNGVHPHRSSLRSIKRSLDEFAKSEKQVFFAYYDATDLVAHLKGPDALERVLRGLDEALKELRSSSPRPFHVVLLSDHGMAGSTPLINVRRPVKRALKRAGFHLGKHLRRESDVVFTPYGLVSSFVLATQPGHEVEVAVAISAVEGVDLCAAAVEDDHWRIESERGRASIRRRSVAGEERWSYEASSGDPLRLSEVLDSLGAKNGAWLTDEQWLDATLEVYFPDPLYRIARGFDLVENPASVICSVGEGYMYGAAVTSIASRLSVGPLRWTHGALHRQASLGFLMSDVPGWEPPKAARFNRALLPFADQIEK